jgi:hypothetical protein
MKKIELELYNIGAHFNGYPGNTSYFCISVDRVDNVDILSGDLFSLYLNEMVTHLKSRMQFVKDRREDISKLKNLHLKTIYAVQFTPEFAEQFATESMEKVLVENLGGLAVVSVYATSLYKELLDYAKEVEDISYVFDLGREYLNGVSKLERYIELVNTELLPRFPLDQYSYNERGSE